MTLLTLLKGSPSQPANVSPSTVVGAASFGVPTLTPAPPAAIVTANVAWTYETGNIGGENTISCPLPSTVTSGDWILFYVSAISATNNIAGTPSGWTELLAPTATVAGNTSSKIAIYAKKYAAGDETGSVSIAPVTADASTRWAAATFRVQNADQTTLLEAGPTVQDGFTGNTITAPSVTSVSSLTGMMFFYARGATNVFATDGSWTVPTGTTKLVEVNTHTTASNLNFMAAALDIGAGAASGTKTSTVTMSGAGGTLVSAGQGVSLVLKAATVGASGVTPTTIAGSTTMAQPYVAPGTTTATVTWAWVGLPTQTAVTVAAKLTSGTNARLKVATNAGLTTGVVFSAPVAINANGYVKLPISGLSANTQYFYALEVDGGSITGHDGSFKTAPSGATSFNITFASCNTSGSVSSSWANMITKTPAFMVHCGDYHYDNIATNTPSSFRASYDGQMAKADSQEAFMRQYPTAYVWSDHDFGGNNSVGNTPAKPAAQSVYRELVPHIPLPADQGPWNGSLTWNGEVCKDWSWGRVKFIQTDERSNKSPQANTDNSSKTMLGATQKQWFKDVLTNCTESLIIWAGDVPWTGAVIAGDDHWASYDTERQELATFITGLTGKTVIRISGDQHCLAYNDGTLNSPGSLVCFSAAPLNNTSSTKGSWTVTYTASTQNYGQLVFTDTGTSTIDVAFTGFDSANVQRIAKSVSVTVPAGADVAATTISGAASFGAPTVVGGTGAAVTPATISRLVVIPTPTEGAGAGPAPVTISRLVAIAAPTVAAGTQAAITPTTIAGAVAFGTQTVRISTPVAATTIAGTTTFPTATESAGATPTPATISRLVAIPAPTLVAGTGAAISAATASGAVSFGAPTVAAAQSAAVTPATASGAVTIPAPSVAAGGAAAATPATIAGTVTTPTATTRAGALVLAAAVAGVVAFGGATIAAGQGANTSPATVAGSVVVGPHSVAAGGAAAVSPATINGAVTVPSDTLGAGAIITPATISRLVSIPAPVVGTSAGAAPATISRLVVMSAPTVRISQTAAPTSIARIVVIPTPTIAAPTVASPPTILGSASIIFGIAFDWAFDPQATFYTADPAIVEDPQLEILGAQWDADIYDDGSTSTTFNANADILGNVPDASIVGSSTTDANITSSNNADADIIAT